MCVRASVCWGKSHYRGFSCLKGKLEMVEIHQSEGLGLFRASLLKSAMNKTELEGRCPRGLKSLNQGKV